MPGGARVDLTLERQRILALGTSRSGPIYRHMLKVGVKIGARATANLSGRMVNVQTGVLRAAQSHPPDVRVQGEKVIGAVVNNTRYALYVHEGTKPHEIAAPVASNVQTHRRRVLAWADPAAAKGVRFATSVRHPGTKARPFLRDAADHVVRNEL